MSAYKNLLQALSCAIDRENQAIAASDFSALPEFTRSKNQLLLEITRRPPAPAESGAHDAEVETLLADVRDKLARNCKLLERNIQAATHISDLLSNAVCNIESDGTYGANGRRPGGMGYGRTPLC